MTISNPTTPQQPQHSTSDVWRPEDEIDVRAYVLVLVSWWREILLIAAGVAIVSGVAVLLMRSILPPTYESSATVAIARTQSNITFDERYTTLSSDSANAVQASSAARRAALLGLVESGAVAQAVIEQLGNLLAEEERNPAQLLADQRVSAELVGATGSTSNSDLIRITVKADSPTKAAAIVNAWAEHYVEQVNRIYGQIPGDLVASIATELASAQTEYESAQADLEAFVASSQIDRLARLIEEKKAFVDSLQAGKQAAITTIVEEELIARRKTISAYIGAQADNRLLAFQKEQAAKQSLMSALIDADTAGRLHVLQTEMDSNTRLFDAYATADVEAKLAVINQQVQSRIQLLKTYYETRAKLQRLLADAQTIRAQSTQAGEAGAATNSLAILLLKSQVYATSAELPGNLQITLGNVGDINSGAQNQAADLDALIQSIEVRLTELGQLIAIQSNTLQTNADYNIPTQVQLAAGDASPLADAIQERYRQLFALSTLATGSLVISTTTPIFAAIQAQYPDLFDIGALAALSDGVTVDNPLAVLGSEQAKKLLQLQGLEDLPTYTAAAESLTRSIDQLEADIQTLQAQQEAESSRQQQLVQRRDLAWGTLITLKNKSAEVRLSSTAANSEVRLAAPGIAPIDPVIGLRLGSTTLLMGVVGLMAAALIAFFANSIGVEPWLGRKVNASPN